jgi:hypothetical protein
VSGLSHSGGHKRARNGRWDGGGLGGVCFEFAGLDVHRISGPAGVENANLGEGSRAESGISYETAWHMRGRIRSEKAHQKDIRQRLIGVIGVEESEVDGNGD